MADNTQLYFQIIATDKKVSFDYTPNWRHNGRFVDNVVFPKVLTNKKYVFRVVVDGTDYGTAGSYGVEDDGSQKVNFTEYNKGHGFADSKKIQVYAVDPSNGNQYLVAQWN